MQFAAIALVTSSVRLSLVVSQMLPLREMGKHIPMLLLLSAGIMLTSTHSVSLGDIASACHRSILSYKQTYREACAYTSDSVQNPEEDVRNSSCL